jgi:hypothetical protein
MNAQVEQRATIIWEEIPTVEADRWETLCRDHPRVAESYRNAARRTLGLSRVPIWPDDVDNQR